MWSCVFYILFLQCIFYKCSTSITTSLKRSKWLILLSPSSHQQAWGNHFVLRKATQTQLQPTPKRLGHPSSGRTFLVGDLVSCSPLGQVPTVSSVFVITVIKIKQKAIVLSFLSWNTLKSLKCTITLMKENNSFMLKINITFNTFSRNIFLKPQIIIILLHICQKAT